MTFTAKAPIEKLPIAARKSVRDNFESKRTEYAEKISATMGDTWTIEVNVNEVYPYATDNREKDDIGTCIANYFGPFVQNLSEFVAKYGEDGKADLNAAVARHVVTLSVDETGKHNYCGSDIKDGTLRLLFQEGKLGMFPSDASKDIITALKNAPAPAGSMNLLARNGIKADYEAAVEDVRAELAKIVAVPDLKLSPNFDFNYAKLAAMGDKAPGSWDKNLGQNTLAYFKGVARSLKNQKFDSDDILQEGFQEAVTKNEITLKIIDVLACGGSYNEVVIEDGVLVVQTLPGQWGSWYGDAANRLTDML